ncbi:MAG: hypothetical protein MJZ68_03435 [archaeon]|nr:hypothetical protein [archaeon]
MKILVDDGIQEMVLREKHDFRICTACMGPALVSTEVKPAKPTDIAIPVGDYNIYVSRIQAPYICRITNDMIYSEDEIDSCPAFYDYSDRKRDGSLVTVDEDVEKMILDSKQDYRICTACDGPALVPTDVKGPKATDIVIPVGDYHIYISRIQVRHIRRISMDFVYSKEEIESCPAFRK